MEFEEIRHQKIVVDRFGDPGVLRLTEAWLGAPPPGHARVKVLAVGVGLTDVMARTGNYILQRKTPFTPGYELVGEVVDYQPEDPGTISDSADEYSEQRGNGHQDVIAQPGTRVAVSLTKMGAYSEYVTLPAWQLVPVPDSVDTATAATIPLDYLTATSLLETHGRVGPGDAVLIQGAGGGVGQAVIQLGKRLGLRMYGTASTPGGKERLDRHGVYPIDYRREDFEAVLRDREPDGIQAVFDHIGGRNLRKGRRILASGGVVVSHAFAGRPGHMVADTVRGALTAKLLGLLPRKRTALATIPSQIKSDHRWYRESLLRLLQMARDGVISTAPGAVFPLDEAASAHRALERREVSGKLVLTTD